MSQKPRPSREPSIVTNATELHAAAEALASLTARLAETNLPTWKAIVRGNEQLTEAVALHQRFVAALEALTHDVGAVRDRHNAAAEVLSAQAARIEARRAAHAALEQRFADLAGAAREADEILRSIPAGDPTLDPTAHAAAVSAGFAAARERIGRAVDEADAVGVAAREAGFSDLVQQANGVSQQLASMLRTLSKAP